MKKIILLSAFVILGVLVLGQAVYAASSILSVQPASLDSAVGKVFNVSIQMDPASNKICVIKGALSFDNLSCQSIAVQNGLMAQTTPTCASPSFMLGIPKCVIADQNILSVSVKGNNIGTGKIFLSGVKVIGAGADVAFNSQGGAYNITTVQTPALKSTPTTTAKTTSDITAQQVAQPAQQITQQVETPAQQTTAENNIPASVGTASVASATLNFFSSPVVIIIIAIFLLLILFWAFNKFFKKNKTQVK